MINTMRCLVVAATIAVLGPVSAHANPILEFSTGGASVGALAENGSLGWYFTTNSAITVTALDAYLSNGVTSTTVRLYGANGTTITSATVSTSDTPDGSPVSFYSHTLATSVALTAHTTYYIAEDVIANKTQFYTSVTPTTDSSISYGGGVLSSAGTGYNPTTDAFGGSLGHGYFGPNFDIGVTQATPTPEPSSMVLCATGLLALAAYGRSRTKRRAAR
jgi:hypothetical protein